MRIPRFSMMVALAVILVGSEIHFVAAQPSGDTDQETDRGRRGGGRRGRGGFGGGGFGGPGFGGPGFGAPGMGALGISISRATLLQSDKVRKELSVDEGQAATVEAALEAYRTDARESRPDFGRLRDMSDEERAAEMERIQKAAAELTMKTDETLAALLEPEQLERLDQISLQLSVRTNPVGALKDDDLRKKLGVSEAQATQLDAAETESGNLMEAMREKMMEQFQSGERPDFSKIQEMGETIRKEIAEQVMGVLNEEQKTQLAALQGDKFELEMSDLIGGRGGRRGGFGGGRGFGGQGGGRPEGASRRNRRPPVEE